MAMVAGDDADQSSHETEALHHDAASRLLAALGCTKLASRQASRLSRTLRVDARTAPVSTSGLARRTLFGPPTGELLRPASEVKGLQHRSSKSSERHDAPTGDALGDGPTYGALQQAVPEWYEMHNAHCLGCITPLLLGVNATFASHARGIVCRTCGTLTPTSEPSITSKRAYRSLAMRKHAKAEEVTATVKQVQESEVRAQKRKQVNEVTEGLATTLAQRQTELKRKAKLGKRAAMARVEAEMDSTGSTGREAVAHQSSDPASAPGGKGKGTPQTLSHDRAAAVSQKEARIPSAAPPQSTPRVSATKRQANEAPSTNTSRGHTSPHATPHHSSQSSSSARGHRDALRQMLDAKRKQRSNAANKPTTSSGLQDFLGSL